MADTTIRDLGLPSQEPKLSPNEKTGPDMGSESDDSDNVKTAEGGYGWVIVGASFFNMFCLDGLISIYGLLYPDLLSNFGADPAITALPGSLVVGMSCFLGPFTGKLIGVFGVRPVVVLGSCITSAGFICSFVAKSITAFFFSHGLLTGIGCGLFYLPSATLVNTYFDRKRGIAQGIIMAGSGMGVIVLSPLTKILMDYYGWRGVLLLWAGILLNICISGVLMRPAPSVRRQRYCSEASQNRRDSSNANEEVLRSFLSLNGNHSDGMKNGPLQNGRTQTKYVYIENTDHTSTHSLPHIQNKQDVTANHLHTYSSLQSVKYPSPNQHIHRQTSKQNMFDMKDIFLTGSADLLETYASRTSVNSKQINNHIDDSPTTSFDEVRHCKCSCKEFMKDVAFWLLVAGAFAAQMAQHIPMTFIPDYCEQVGLGGEDIATLFILFGVVNMAGRFGSGLLASFTMFSPLLVCNFGALACAVACFLFWLCTSFETLAVFIAVYGFFIGFSCPTQPLITLEYVGLDNLTLAFGIVTMAKGPAAMAGPPLAGALYQLTQKYSYAIAFAGGLLGLSAVGQSFMPLVRKHGIRLQETHQDINNMSNQQHSRDKHL
ncbi:monocarboxylate transporter 14-like [Argopecten irradians]|uniref:monocarboxylate transporter 14-like n=1 Tax=Argopecten irradians TaxID=31199 RepID=UPI003711EAA2